MATIQFKKGDEYLIKLSKLAENGVKVTKEAIYAGADIVTNEIRRELEDNLRDPASVALSGGDAFGIKNTSNNTGELLEALGIAEIDKDSAGNWNTKIGFDGYDKKGVPNQLKARAMESGTSLMRKRPFVRPAVNKTKKKAITAMAEVIDNEIKKIM